MEIVDTYCHILASEKLVLRVPSRFAARLVWPVWLISLISLVLLDPLDSLECELWLVARLGNMNCMQRRCPLYENKPEWTPEHVWLQ